MVSMEVETITFRGFDGLTLVADVRGEPRAWPVLFLHGGGQTRHAWGKTAENVASDGWRSVTLDLRGHGDSDWSSSGEYSLAAFSADCAAVADQLGRPPVLVGASLGGISALLAEGTSQRTVACGLVLVDIAPKTNPEGVKRIRQFMESGVGGFGSLDEAAAAIAAYTPNRVRPVNYAGLRKVLRERGGRWYWHWDPRVLKLRPADVRGPGYGELLDRALDHIHVPMMLVRGRLSDVVSEREIDDLLARKPDVEVVEIEGAAHMIAGDQNDAFSTAVVSFLQKRIRPTIGS